MLEKIRNQVAKDSAFDDWDDLCFCHGEMESIKRFEELTKFCDEVSQRYAQSQTQELQEQNAELVRLLEELSKTTSGSRFLRIKREAKELLTKYNQTKSHDSKRKSIRDYRKFP